MIRTADGIIAMVKSVNGASNHDYASDTSPRDSQTAAATFCATIVDEWVRAGIRTAFVAPGSRSTPLVLALFDNSSIDMHIFHDERSASFAALGHALSSGKPAIIVCSSGTAAAHFHAAILEASAAAVPLIICSADRPAELKGIAAPQTIDQTKLYANAVRHFTEPGPPQADQSHWWRSWASQLASEAAGWAGRAGPVHANLAFREPLLGQPAALPEGRTNGAAWHRAAEIETRPSAADVSSLAERISNSSGIIICGRGTSDPAAVMSLAERLDWPLLADHRSGARHAGRSIAHSDLLLRSSHFAEANKPELVIRFGEIHASKVLAQWLRACEPFVVAGVPQQRWVDPERLANQVFPENGLATALLASITSSAPTTATSTATRSAAPVGTPTTGQREVWMRADAAAAAEIRKVLAEEASISEPGIARAVLQDAPPGSQVVLSSSMPVRDVEWFADARDDVDVLSNRGTNGIDGVTSTAIGAALTGRPTTLLIGDIAFLHDSPGLIGLAARAVDLHIIVVNNDGGGIFSFLPQASELPQKSFETLFGTPHNSDLAALCAAHNIVSQPWPATTGAKQARGGVMVTIAKTDRADNVRVHAELVRRVNNALS